MKIKFSVFIVLIFCVAVSFTPGKIKWVAIGDSITYLNDHADETGNRVTKGYLTRVVEKLPIIHTSTRDTTAGLRVVLPETLINWGWNLLMFTPFFWELTTGGRADRLVQ